MKKVSHVHIHKVKVSHKYWKTVFFCEIVLLLHLISLLHYIKLSTWNIENAILLLLRLGKKTAKCVLKKNCISCFTNDHERRMDVNELHFKALSHYIFVVIFYLYGNCKCICNLLGSSLDDVNVFSTNRFLNLDDGFRVGLLKCRTSAKFDI